MRRFLGAPEGIFEKEVKIPGSQLMGLGENSRTSRATGKSLWDYWEMFSDSCNIV